SRLMGRRPTGLTELSESLALYARARPFLGLALIVALYGRAGTLVLSITSDAATVGLFAAAERLTLLVSVLQGVIASAVLPALGALVEQHPGRALAVARSSMRLLMVCVIPAGGALIL